MLLFQRVKPSLAGELLPLLRGGQRLGCEYSFANLCMWGRNEYVKIQDYLVFFAHYDGKSVYTFPVGSGDIKVPLEAILEDSRQRGIPCRISGVTAQDRLVLERLYPGAFHFRACRDSGDYLYSVRDLATLPGRKYQQKRNHLNRFRAQYPDARLLPMTREDFPRVRELLNTWYGSRQEEGEDYALEKRALERAMSHWDELGLEGLCLYVEDRLRAFAVASVLSDTVMDIHFEKADPEFPLGYAAINQGFAAFLLEKHPRLELLNREDDMGIPGLRKAKLSYQPLQLLEKFRATWISEDER